MASGPLTPDHAGRDGQDGDLESWRRRALEAEQLARELADELTATRAELAALDASHLTLFDEIADDEAPLEPGRAPDGSEPGVLPVALLALATVAGLAGALSWINNGLGSGFTLLMLAVTAGFGWAAWRTRVVKVEVTFAGSVLTITRGEHTARFDLASDSIRVEVIGHPGSTDWRVRFYRRALDPVDVDARMVDPEQFLRRLREFRPGI